MRINNTEKINQIKEINELIKNQAMEEKELGIGLMEEGSESKDSYEKTQSHPKDLVYDLAKLERLREESENIYEKLINIVEEKITKQAVEEEKLLVDKTMVSREENIDKVSEEISNFIKEVSKGEEGKINVLKNALEEGFKRVEESFGKLPEISEETHKKIIEKLNDFIFIEKIKNQPETAEAQIRELIEATIVEQIKESGLVDIVNFIKTDEEILEEISQLLGDHEVKVEGSKLDEGQILKKLGLRREDLPILKIIYQAKEEKEVGLTNSLRNQNIIEDKSDRIVAMIKTAGKEDLGKLGSLIRIVEESFLELEKFLGILPEASKRTYKLIMEKMDIEVEKYGYRWPFLFAGNIDYFQGKYRISSLRTRIFLILSLTTTVLYHAIKFLRK